MEGIKTERGWRKEGRRAAAGIVRMEVVREGRSHSSTFPFGWILDGRGPAEREVRWKAGGEKRDGVGRRGGARVAFVCFPRFKASLEK